MIAASGGLASMADSVNAPTGESTVRPFADSIRWQCAAHWEGEAARAVFVTCTALPQGRTVVTRGGGHGCGRWPYERLE